MLTEHFQIQLSYIRQKPHLTNIHRMCTFHFLPLLKSFATWDGLRLLVRFWIHLEVRKPGSGPNHNVFSQKNVTNSNLVNLEFPFQNSFLFSDDTDDFDINYLIDRNLQVYIHQFFIPFPVFVFVIKITLFYNNLSYFNIC